MSVLIAHNFLDCLSSALGGSKLRCRSWMEGCYWRYNTRVMRWEAIGPGDKHWLPISPNPMDMLRKDWEIHE